MRLSAALLGLATLAALALPATAVHAQSVDEIVSRGVIKIGVNSGAPPFSLVDATGNTVGYDVDTAHLLAEYLGVDVEITAYPTNARIPALESGQVDVVVATLSPTPARARAVMFTMPYSTFQIVLLAAADSALASPDDLSGVKVGVSRGTPQEVALQKAAPADVDIARFDDDSTTMQALVSGQVEAIVIPETVFIELKKARPELAFEPKYTFFNQFMSIAVRKDAFELRQWLNTTLSFIKTSGELDAISEKWTGHALPATMPIF